MDIPLLKDLPFAKYADLDLAVRQTHNKTSDKLNGTGSNSTNFTTWKASLIYDIIDGLRIRASPVSRRARAEHARTLRDTACRRPASLRSFQSPWTVPAGQYDPATVRSGGGSPDLVPEKADTWTIGTVIRPTFAENLSFSVDWYQIKLKNAITVVGTAELATDCNDLGIFCDRLTFAPGAEPGKAGGQSG